MGADLTGLPNSALLGREELPIDLEPARRRLQGRRVLITGAGGSVGSALAELMLSLYPEQMVLLDHHEHALYRLYRQFRERGLSEQHQFALVDVRHTAKLERLIERCRPHVVFHLAAYKHVPFGELFPDEVFSVNVQATHRLLELCASHDVEAFAYPSSDKAVNPPSLYGATKRLAETLVQSVGQQCGRPFGAARYVNIIGSAGSVIETLTRQILQGKPLTITDPAMTRYWITMGEALWLILSVVSSQAEPGVLMLDAGDEVSVSEMALRLARHLAPGQEIPPVRYTGLRPGERLREELLSANEHFERGPYPGLLRVHNRRREQHLASVVAIVTDLERLLARDEPESLRRSAMAAAMALQ